MGLFSKFMKKSNEKEGENNRVEVEKISSSSKKYKVIIACGSGIATSTMASNKIEKAFREKGIPLDIFQCKIGELEGKAKSLNPDFVIHTVVLPKGQSFDCPVFSGVPFLTGVGADSLIKEIIDSIVNK